MDRRVDLTPIQAATFTMLFREKQAAEDRFALALNAAGIDPAKLVGGTVDGDEPHLIVREEDEE